MARAVRPSARVLPVDEKYPAMVSYLSEINIAMKEKLQAQLFRLRDTEQEMALAYKHEPCAERLDELMAIQARIMAVEAELQAHNSQ